MINNIKKYGYGILSTAFGRKSRINNPRFSDNFNIDSQQELLKILKKHGVQGESLALINNKGETVYMTGGYGNNPISINTKFRIASISKFIIALCIMKMQEMQYLNVEEDISIYLGQIIRNPQYPDITIRIKHIMAHSSSIIDGENYFKALNQKLSFKEALEFSNKKPGECFNYSNLAAGLLEIIIEKSTGMELEQALEYFLFKDLKIQAYIYPPQHAEVADCFRVFPKNKKANYAFNQNSFNNNAEYRQRPLEYRYIKVAGAIHISAMELLKIVQELLNENIISNKSQTLMLQETLPYPKKERELYHGLAVFIVKDKRISKNTLYGHQGFAYGAVNGLFYDTSSKQAIVSLNNGAREWRNGHIACLNEDIIKWFQKYY